MHFLHKITAQQLAVKNGNLWSSEKLLAKIDVVY